MSKDHLNDIAPSSESPLSEHQRAQQFRELKAELEQAVTDAEAGEFELFDPILFETEAYDWPGWLKA
jgi:hypothetical protein